MRAIKNYWKEHIRNYSKIWILAQSSRKKETVRTTFGPFWNLIRDIIFLVAYSVFFTLISSGSKIDGVPRLTYLASGLVAWFFISAALNQSSKCIKKNRIMFTKMKFPITIIPTFEVLATYLIRLPSLLIAFVIVGATYGLQDFNILLFMYYNIAMVLLMHSIVLVFSGFIALSKDFTQLYLAFTRILFYFVPILWTKSNFNSLWFQTILVFNPFVYVIDGFRDAFVFGNRIGMFETSVFWIVVLTLHIMGCVIQDSFKRIYSDFL